MYARNQVGHQGGRPRQGTQLPPRQPAQQEHWRGSSASGHAHMQNGHRSRTQTTNQPTYTYACPQYYCVLHINLSLPPLLIAAPVRHDHPTPYFDAGTSSNRNDNGNEEFLDAATQQYSAPLPSATAHSGYNGNWESGFAGVGATALSYPSVNGLHPGQGQQYWHNVHQPNDCGGQSGQGRQMNPGGQH